MVSVIVVVVVVVMEVSVIAFCAVQCIRTHYSLFPTGFTADLVCTAVHFLNLQQN